MAKENLRIKQIITNITRKYKPSTAFDSLLKILKQKKLMTFMVIGSLIILLGTTLALYAKKSYFAQTSPRVILTVAPSLTPTPTANPILPSPNPLPTNTPMPTPTPTIAIFKPGSFTYKNAEISSRFIEVSISPGGETEAFIIKSKGAHEYKIDSLRIFGVSGLSLSPTQSVMTNDETKQIKLLSDSTSTPGRYSGFVDLKIDGNEIVLFITITVGSQQGERYIRITSPKGGETYREGDTVKLTWESKGVEIDGISVVSENGKVLNTGNGVTATGFEWKSAKYFDSNATNFKIYINSNSVIGDAPFITIK